MTNETPDTTALLASLNDTTAEFLALVSAFSDTTINAIPYEDSWTAAQVADHVTRSNTSMIRSLLLPGQAANRPPDAGVPELQKTFLDFTTRLQSPDFILPSEQVYDKEKLVTELQRSIDKVREVATTADPAEMLRLPIFGEVTKLELLHFIVYHTQRHIHQLKKIKTALDKK